MAIGAGSIGSRGIGSAPASGGGSPSTFKAWHAHNAIQLVRQMKKNVASQVIGVQMVTASDGSAFTGTVSCTVTKDGGTQTAGGGSVTHEGNGFHTYTPTQAETNADHIGFTFTGTGAIPATVQVYTSFPQTADVASGVNVTQFGGVAGTFASGRPEVNTTHAAGTAWGSGAITAGSIATGAITNAKFASGAIDAAALATDAVTEIQSGLSTLTSGDVAGAVWNAATATYGSVGSYGALIETNLDDQVSAKLNASSYTAPLDAAGTATAVWDALTVDHGGAGTYANVVENGYSVLTRVDLLIEADGPDYRFTTNALEQAPAAPTAASVADAVWDEALSGHLTVGTSGRALWVSGSILDETTATGTPTTTTLQLTAGSGSDDYYNDLEIIPLSGPAAGQARVITDYVGATKTVTVDEPWTSAPASGNSVLIRATHKHSINQINATVDTAISDAALATAANLALVKAKTDSLTFTVAGQVDSNVESINTAAVLGDGTSGNKWRGS